MLIGKFLDLVKAQVNLLERLKQPHMLLHVKQLQTIVLKVYNHQVKALREDLHASHELLVPQRDHTYLTE